ncbi:hypothetical protein ACELLULO517_21095 [Acidisoma cellulosilytica]|uniref:PRC-barrel domain containing protein n=1 Tax=Acidisoma cellulosilyticum TaxID=2802395 RepID=A0A963Z638_9PROT|nr:hypothetical protein [Acidisoma cellulosilyticum]MCB8882755.1 hypothetical protein [Acidisoma cellulosilyticum]
MPQNLHLIVALAMTFAAAPALAQSPMPGGMPPPPGMSLAESTAMRFPQPVRVGDLTDRLILQPVESQIILGRVHAVVRNAQGEVSVVMNFGGFYGYGGRLIAVPIDAMVLLGDEMEVVAYTPKQLAGFATFSADGTTPVADDAFLKVGLAKPSH